MFAFKRRTAQDSLIKTYYVLNTKTRGGHKGKVVTTLFRPPRRSRCGLYCPFNNGNKGKKYSVWEMGVSGKVRRGNKKNCWSVLWNGPTTTTTIKPGEVSCEKPNHVDFTGTIKTSVTWPANCNDANTLSARQRTCFGVSCLWSAWFLVMLPDFLSRPRRWLFGRRKKRKP